MTWKALWLTISLLGFFKTILDELGVKPFTGALFKLDSGKFKKPYLLCLLKNPFFDFVLFEVFM